MATLCPQLWVNVFQGLLRHRLIENIYHPKSFDEYIGPIIVELPLSKVHLYFISRSCYVSYAGQICILKHTLPEGLGIIIYTVKFKYNVVHTVRRAVGKPSCVVGPEPVTFGDAFSTFLELMLTVLVGIMTDFSAGFSSMYVAPFGKCPSEDTSLKHIRNDKYLCKTCINHSLIQIRNFVHAPPPCLICAKISHCVGSLCLLELNCPST